MAFSSLIDRTTLKKRPAHQILPLWTTLLEEESVSSNDATRCSVPGSDLLKIEPGLHLSAIKLVALSACDTGLAMYRMARRVFGLRRAFLLAGARTLVIAL
jgi:CHAT domain-containing protein